MFTVKMPTVASKKNKFVSDFADLFNENGELLDINTIIDELDPETVEKLKSGGYLLEIQAETPNNQEPPKVEKLADGVRNNMTFEEEGFKFTKVPNTSKKVTRIITFKSKEEAIESFEKNGLEGRQPNKPQMQINYAIDGRFGGVSALIDGLNISTSKGTESLCIVQMGISENDYQANKNIEQPKTELLCDEYRISKGGEKLETLNFPTSLNGDLDEAGYKCLVFTSGKKRSIIILKEIEDENGRMTFSINGRLFDNLYQHN